MGGEGGVSNQEWSKGCYSILSIKNNKGFYIQLGLGTQSTNPECTKNHMRSLCVYNEATEQINVCLCMTVHKCEASVL